MNQKQLAVVKENEFDIPLSSEIDSVEDSCLKECHFNCFDIFNYDCKYGNNFTIISNNEIITLTISGKSMNFYVLNKTIKIARQSGFIFNQINKLTTIFFRNYGM